MRNSRVRSHSIPLCASIALTFVASAHGQSTDEDELALVYGDGPVLSIATGEPQRMRRAPAVATVITADDIAATGARDLDEVLESVPGLHVSYAPEYIPLYVIRGIRSARTNPHVLMLVNGIPMTSVFAGDRGNIWGGLPLENVARIELIRGPGSALYGADAYAGVINIITRNAAEIDGTRAGLRAGSFGTRNAWVMHGASYGAFNMAAYLNVGSTNGPGGIVAADAQSRNDAAFRTNASLAPGEVRRGYSSIDAQLDLEAGKWRFRTAYKQRDKLESGAGAGQALDPYGSSFSERFTADLGWNDRHFGKHWDLGVQASFLHLNEHVGFVVYPSGTSFAALGGGTFPNGMIGRPSRWERQARLAVSALYTGIDHHRIRIGAGYHDIDLYKIRHLRNYDLLQTRFGFVPRAFADMVDFTSTSPYMFPARRSVAYAHAQDEWTLARDWTLTAGVRHDRYSDFGGTTNPRVALVWDAAYNVTAKLLYGRAFRAPSFAESYLINNPVATGNPALKPERISTLEFVLDWHPRQDLRLGLNLFRHRMRDLIDFVPNAIAITGATAQNIGRQTGNGIEVEAAWEVTRRVIVSGNYAYQRSIDENTGRDAGGAPRHHTYLRADWRVGSEAAASAQLNWIGRRERAGNDTRAPLAGYRTLDLTLRSPVGKGRWDFAFSLRNVFDATGYEPSPYATPAAPIPGDLPLGGRAAFLQVSCKM